MGPGIGRVAQVLADHVQHHGDDGGDDHGAPELKFPAGSDHGILGVEDQLAQGAVDQAGSLLAVELALNAHLDGALQGDLVLRISHDGFIGRAEDPAGTPQGDLVGKRGKNIVKMS